MMSSGRLVVVISEACVVTEVVPGTEVGGGFETV